MKKIVLAVLLSMFSLQVYAESLECGDAQATVLSSQKGSFPYFGLSIFHRDYQKTYTFKVDKEYFKLRCETALDGSKVFLALHTCGGSGCADLSNFGIIDTKNGEMLLSPSAPYKGNLEKAIEILKFQPKPFLCRPTQPNETEICKKSKAELG